jgi:arylsulfatase
MRRHCLPGVLALALLAGGSPARAERPPVTIDLVRQGTGLLDGRRVPLRGDDGRLHVPAGSTLAIAVRLPAAPRLRLAPASDTAHGDVTVTLDLEDGTQRRLTLAEVADDDGTVWSADLAELDDHVVRVRLENRSAADLAWRRAEIDGGGWPRAALLSARRPADRPLNVVLYVVDTLRADHLNTYGYDLPTSPKLAKLARRAALFRYAYSPGPNTAATVPSLLTSRYPSEMSGRLATNGPGRRTLAEAFREAGYDTAAYQANFGLVGALGYERGFDAYHTLKKEVDGAWRYWRASEVNESALAWLRERGDRPFFLYVQIMDVHVPHDAHPFFAGRVHPPQPEVDMAKLEEFGELVTKSGLDETAAKKLRAFFEALDPRAYDEDVAYATHEFARFLHTLRRLGRLDDTVVLLTADHGEPLGEHGAAMHGVALYEEQIHVPLMVWAPGLAPGWREDVTGLLDVPTTLLDLADVAVPDSFLGRSLARAHVMESPPQAMGERLRHRSQLPIGTYVREGPWKLITDPKGIELFHLPTDPDEAANVTGKHAVLTDYLVTQVTARIPFHRGEGTTPTAFDEGLPAPIKRELHDALRALGYLE